MRESKDLKLPYPLCWAEPPEIMLWIYHDLSFLTLMN